MDDRHEELRLALVMNGGVSLAVWMGGVTNEIFRLVKGSHSVYRGLLELTECSARVDVISGTSAGGVNGAALTTALQYDGDFSLLRGVWLEVGAFSDLLRAPFGENPGSLLRGDDFFLPQIQAAFERLAPVSTPVRTPAQMPVDLRLTTTLLSGSQGHTVDDLGTRLHDVDYRGHFHFLRCPNTQDDPFLDRDKLVQTLARAARSTASFPFAFEPSFVADDSYRLLDARGCALPTPRYVIDGGILDNKPFRGALEAIFWMPATHRVRRVLAYVNPDPGDGPENRIKDAKQGAPAKPPMPGMSKVVAAALLGIPMSQTISDQLQEIKDHNDKVRRRRDSVLTIARLDALSKTSTTSLAQGLFPLYRRRRLQHAFDGFFVNQLAPAARRLAADGVSPEQLIGQPGRAQLESLFVHMKWSGWIPEHWPASPDDPAYAADTWEWGLFPVEFAAKVLLGLLRRTHSLADFRTPPDRPKGDGAVDSHDVGCDWRDPDTPPPAAPPAVPPVEGTFAWCWEEAYKCMNDMRIRRRAEDKCWLEGAEKLVAFMTTLAPLGAPGRAIGQAQFGELFEFITLPERRKACGDFAHRIAELVRKVCVLADAQFDQLDKHKVSRDETEEIAAAREFVDYLAGPDPAQCRDNEILERIMRLEVIEFAFNDHDDISCDSVIELVQISGDTPTPLRPGNGVARDKLLGLQVAHFGAFYRQSWRANDWTFGRLDGAQRLVRILLNPTRLRRLHRNGSAYALKAIHDIALQVPSRAMRDELEHLWVCGDWAAKIARELAYLDDPHAQIPDALPASVAAITARLHLGILREELDQIVVSIAADVGQGAEPGAKGSELIARLGHRDVREDASKTGSNKRPKPEACVFTPSQAREALEGLLLGGESLADEAGSDLFTRTIAHAAAATQNLLSSKSASLGALSTLFASLKLPFVGFYFVARGIARQSRTSAALHAGLLVAGIAIVLIQLFLSVKGEKPTLPGSLSTLGWIFLAYGLLTSILRRPRTVGTLLVVLALVVAAAQADPVVLGIAALVGLPLVLGTSWRWLEPLQWLGGFALVILSAAICAVPPAKDPGMWTFPPPWDAWWEHPEIKLGAAMCAVLVLAMWQTTAISARFELWAQRLRRRRK